MLHLAASKTEDIRCRNRWSIVGQTGWLKASGSEKVKALALPLYTGSVLGQPGRIVALIVALLLAAQVSAEILLWAQRRKRRIGLCFQ